MALKVPRKVPRYKLNIKSTPWTIYIVTQLQFEKMNPELKGAKLCGLSDPNFHAIYILSEYPIAVGMQTLFHELFHAFVTDLDAVKISMKNGDQAIPEEAAAEAVGICTVELLSHLNLLLDFMTKNLKTVEDEEDE